MFSSRWTLCSDTTRKEAMQSEVQIWVWFIYYLFYKAVKKYVLEVSIDTCLNVFMNELNTTVKTIVYLKDNRSREIHPFTTDLINNEL